ncbi:MAG: type IV pilus twitching motility protein PilT, partial [Acidobacteriota bacterium]
APHPAAPHPAAPHPAAPQPAATRPAASPSAVPPSGPSPRPTTPSSAAPAPSPRPATASPVGSSAPIVSSPDDLLQLGAGQGLRELLAQAMRLGASDLHVHSQAPLRLRLHGELRDAGPELDAAQARDLILGILDEGQRALLEERQQLDFSYAIEGVGRFRSNAYEQQRGLDAVFRTIPFEPPTLADLGLPEDLERVIDFHQGIVLFTGPAGCGKSSTMAAMVRKINEDRPDHILTVEDPIEYVHTSQRCVVNQREVGPHTESFARALRAALREDPDIIAIGELRDLETISLALTAAETGHLVLGTLHTSSAIRTINRLLGVFPPDQQNQIRTMVSESLRAVVSQRLVPKTDGSGRVAALEVLMNTRAVGNLIREQKTFQIQSQMQTGGARGMRLLDNSLQELVQTGVIAREVAHANAEDRKRFAARA